MSDSEFFEDRGDIAHLGAQMRELREAQGLTHEDVSTATHVRPHILRAIEEGRVGADVAAPVYMRGFIKTYCTYLEAEDLWKKYSQRLQSIAAMTPNDDDQGASDYTTPRPMFRRSSIVWVYFVIVIAVLGALYMLWSQRRDGGGSDEGFFLRSTAERTQSVSEDIKASDDGAANNTVEQIAAPVEDAVSNDSANDVPTVPQDGAIASVSVNVEQDRSVDLSWLEGSQAPSYSAVPDMASSSYQPDQKLLIETTRPVRLTVQQGGEILTRRNMPAGGVRSYDVTVATPVTLSAGGAAEITWYGSKYTPIGSGDEPLALTFFPDGKVQVDSGETPHFKDRANDR